MTDIKMAWVDLETTGLSASLDVPLELGIMLTDEWGGQIAADSWLIWEKDKAFQSSVRRGMNNDFVRDMHEKSGLWVDLRAERGFTRAEVDEMACQFLSDNGVPLGKIPMCGNSIGSLDRPFSIVHLPGFNEALSYRNVDISTFKEVCQMVNPVLFENLRPTIGTKADATHRVMDDIRASIREYTAYLDEFLIVGD